MIVYSKTDTDSQIQKANQWLAIKGKRKGGGANQG